MYVVKIAKENDVSECRPSKLSEKQEWKLDPQS